MRRFEIRLEPKRGVRRAGGVLALAVLVQAGLAPAAADPESQRDEAARREAVREPGASDDEGASPSVEESAELPPIVVYVPRSRGSARMTAGAGTRARGVATRLAVLAPSDHVALTTRAQPTLYWFVSEDTETRIDLTLVDEEAIDPLLETTLPGPVHEGIHAFDLAGAGVSLEPGRTYRWYVTLVLDADRRSNDVIAGGAIERIAPSGDLERALREARFRYAPYAVSGIWYDAMDELLSALEEDPDNKRLRLQRAALLEQAELTEVAVHALHASP